MAQDGPWQDLRVLIAVKTYPQPSEKHLETVCTAGVTEEGRWVRLYPIPFRMLESDQQYSKWVWVRARARRRGKDPRPESFKVDVDSIRVERPTGSLNVLWAGRCRLLLPTVSPSLEAIQARRERDGTSLGLFRPARIEGLRIVPDPDHRETQAKINRLRQRSGIPGIVGQSSPLQALPVKFEYSFSCQDAACRGHTMCLFDWEIAQAWRKWRRNYPEKELPDKLRETWIHRLFEDRRGHFIVGTLQAHPTTFTLIGYFSPPRVVPGMLPLF